MNANGHEGQPSSRKWPEIKGNSSHMMPQQKPQKLPPLPTGPSLQPSSQHHEQSPYPRANSRHRPFTDLLGSFWTRNKGIMLVAISQVFGALMHLSARLLELEGEGMHPMQVLFARQVLTTVFCCIYMWWAGVEGFPLGSKDVRLLLVARGVSGFFGIYGMWYSMMYLPLAEATVITFLAPSVSGYICHIFLHEPFTRKEQVASFLALAGVVLIARPSSLFTQDGPDGGGPLDSPIDMPANSTQGHPGLAVEPSPAQRLEAISAALMGVMGAAGAYTFIRWIGKRAHPLISVNYFSALCVIVSTTSLCLGPVLDLDQPALRIALPAGARQWLLLVVIGICGFIMQCMLTEGLRIEKSNRATAMVYTHMLFATAFDRWVFGHEMGLLSFLGCVLIVGSMLWAILTKQEEAPKGRDQTVQVEEARDTEGAPMLADSDDDDDDEGEVMGTDIPLARILQDPISHQHDFIWERS